MTRRFDDIGAVAAFYAGLHAEHGDSPAAVGWNNAHTQIVAFSQLLALDGLTDGATVLDLGCGLGDFKSYLDHRGVRVEYTGWDICESFVARARRRHPDARFEVRDILADPPDERFDEQPDERFDFVVCCGALALRLPDHERWAADMIRAMFGLCRRGLAFNLLTARAIQGDAFAEEDRYFYADPARVLRFCLELSPQVSLDHTTLSHMFAVYVYRGNTGPMERLAREFAPGREFGAGHRAVVDHYASFGMDEELIAYLETLEPGPEVCDAIGLAAVRMGDAELQLRAFEAAVAAAGDSPAALAPLVHLAITHMDAERWDAAISALERARACAPDDDRIAKLLDGCLAAAGGE